MSRSQQIKKASQLLMHYPEILQNNGRFLDNGEGQTLSDRLIWCELETGELRSQITRLLLDAGGWKFLQIDTMCNTMHGIDFGQCVKENMSKIVKFLGVIFHITRTILLKLKQNKLPLKDIGYLIFKLQILQETLSKINFE